MKDSFKKEIRNAMISTAHALYLADKSMPGLERLAREKAAPHLLEFQAYADSVEDDDDMVEKVTTWWRERGLVIEFYRKGPALLSRSARRSEDIQ